MRVGVIRTALDALFLERRVFCSEADFQFALAWKIQELFPDSEVRLEYIPGKFDLNIHIDIAVFIGGEMIPIELKYKTKQFVSPLGAEPVFLKNQGAQDIGRYDFLSDIQRLERLTEGGKYPIQTAYAIILTNDSLYWTQPKRHTNTVDQAFRIHEGTSIHGNRSWAPGTGAGTKQKREEAIQIKGTYRMAWEDYMEAVECSSCKFKFSVVKIEKAALERNL